MTVEDGFGAVLAPAQCTPFTILIPDPPYLLSPFDGEIVTMDQPLFQWTPLQLPLNFEVRFTLQIAEILPGQTPYEALTSNVLHFEDPDITFESFEYPLEGALLESGRTYAWSPVWIRPSGSRRKRRRNRWCGTTSSGRKPSTRRTGRNSSCG